MPDFPVLKTGVAAQYPLGQSVRFQTQTVEFLDGSKQRYALQRRGLRTWTVKLDLLDDREFRAIVDFVERVGSASFLFTDPVSGDSGINCILAGDTFDSVMNGEMTGQATLVIQETV
jgi:phage-related protein